MVNSQHDRSRLGWMEGIGRGNVGLKNGIDVREIISMDCFLLYQEIKLNYPRARIRLASI